MAYGTNLINLEPKNAKIDRTAQPVNYK